MWTDALAQAGGSAPPDPKIALLLQILQFVPLFLILYLLLIRPQQQQRKKLNEMLKALKKGDRVQFDFSAQPDGRLQITRVAPMDASLPDHGAHK